jgi:hypothetical protein
VQQQQQQQQAVKLRNLKIVQTGSHAKKTTRRHLLARAAPRAPLLIGGRTSLL